MKYGYIVHNLNDAAVRRRVRMLELGGAQVRLAGFSRDALLHRDIAPREPLLLGLSADAAMMQRAVSTLSNALFHRKLRAYLADCDAIIARNLEQLAIASAIVGDRPLIYECLDIHRTLVGVGKASGAIRYVEGQLLKRCGALITSSPAFVERHFAHRPFTGSTQLVENKLLIDEVGAEPRISCADPQKRPLVIGWFGMLRCKRTFDFLSELVKSAPGLVEVLIAGKPSPAELPDFERSVADVPGMRYTGTYTYADLPALYGQCHFAWAIDWFEEGLNSSWLLPNRLYEALAFGVVPIALEDIELGRWLKRKGVGLTVASAQDVRALLLAMTEKDMRGLQAAARELERDAVLCRDHECVALVEQLDRVRAA